jgi:hypothetical protein
MNPDEFSDLAETTAELLKVMANQAKTGRLIDHEYIGLAIKPLAQMIVAISEYAT